MNITNVIKYSTYSSDDSCLMSLDVSVVSNINDDDDGGGGDIGC